MIGIGKISKLTSPWYKPGTSEWEFNILGGTKCGVFSCRGKRAKPQKKRPALKLLLGIK